MFVGKMIFDFVLGDMVIVNVNVVEGNCKCV